MLEEFRPDPESGQPIYQQISQHLRSQIVGGKIPAGTLLPSGQELSRSYNVAYRTMVKSLSSLKKEGLLVGIPSQGTYTRPRRPSVRNIAIIFDQKFLTAEDFGSHLDIFQRAGASRCAENGFHLQLFSLPGFRIFSEKEPTLLSRLLKDRTIDGLITYSGPTAADIRQLRRLNIPTVVSRDTYPGTEIPHVIDDAAEGGRQIVRFLVDGLGHRKFKLFLSYPVTHERGRVRPSSLFGQSLLDELKTCGLPLSADDFFHTGYDWEKTVPVLRRWLTGRDLPTALIFCEDTMARKAIQMATELGLSVPGDLSVCCYGDIIPQSNLTAVHIPMDEIARTCVELLERIVEGETVRSVEIPTELIIRETCGPAKRGK